MASGDCDNGGAVANVAGTDFFVSYATADEAWAEWIAWNLEEAGYSTRIQVWDFAVGSHFVHEMHRAAGGAARTVAVLSAEYLASAYAEAEWAAAWAGDPIGIHRRLLVLRVGECEQPGLLRQVVGTDLFDVDENTARDRVLAAARGQRHKPKSPPSFPGRAATATASAKTPTPARRSPLARPKFPGGRVRRGPWPVPRVLIALVLLVALTGGGIVGTGALKNWLGGSGPSPYADTGCKDVQVLGGLAGSPYSLYAQTLADLINDRALNGGNHWSATADLSTSGTSASLRTLAADPKCTLSLAQLNVPVDAERGLGDFRPENGGPIAGLRYVGQVYYDIVHLIVPPDSPIRRLVDLCGKQVLAGRDSSGTNQISTVLIRYVQDTWNCKVDSSPDEGLKTALPRLDPSSTAPVDAVFWAAGAPTKLISDYLAKGHMIRLVPLNDGRVAVAEEWSTVYPDVSQPFVALPLGPEYPGVHEVSTFGTPNGVVAMKSTDRPLVAFVARMLQERRKDFEHDLWPAHPPGWFPTPWSFADSGLCQAVPLHDAAYKAYVQAPDGQAPSGCRVG
ncbi:MULTISPECIES: TIR domain-containing protein [unclassified Parafrankia]|uniref:TIR domain-containing protein n=1 Tax=unclassified Parafrankia TaxID=2994368 RepID=UPI000DA5B60E|nr:MULTISPECIES: TIR domain-containing protein [unclassified Parafrankia]TCJ36017.1 TIR domain-containing protein [Parafrankia sp. BMG5.11]SQD98371.1 TIR protein [Parafrankia sp. Ea1.12]